MRPVVDIHTKPKEAHAQVMRETKDKVASSLGKERPSCVGTFFWSTSLLLAPGSQSRSD